MPLNESDIVLDNFQMKESSIKVEDVPYIEDKSKAYYFFKRLFDVVSSFLVLIILFIPMLIIGLIVVCTSKGPMIYKSERIGRNGKKFICYKFRSMCGNAEDHLNELLDQNEIEGGVTFKMKNDPRITKVGHFLRKTS